MALLSVSLNRRWISCKSSSLVLYQRVFLKICAMTYSCQARAKPVCICERIQVTLFCSVPNSERRPLIYKIHEWINVSVSSHLPEKGKGDVIFGSLKEDRAGGEWGRGTCDGENWGGVGSGREPEGCGGE